MAKGIDYPLELLTDRLAIRSPAVEHAPQLREAIAESIETLRPWMPWADHVPTPAEAKANCAEAVEKFKAGKDYRLHLFLRESGVLVGGSGLHHPDWSVPKFEIGYWVRQSLTRRGYATEAVAEIARFALAELGARRVQITASAANERSCRVCERAGFTLEGELHNCERHIDGSLRHTRIYAITR